MWLNNLVVVDGVFVDLVLLFDMFCIVGRVGAKFEVGASRVLASWRCNFLFFFFSVFLCVILVLSLCFNCCMVVICKLCVFRVLGNGLGFVRIVVVGFFVDVSFGFGFVSVSLVVFNCFVILCCFVCDVFWCVWVIDVVCCFVSVVSVFLLFLKFKFFFSSVIVVGVLACSFVVNFFFVCLGLNVLWGRCVLDCFKIVCVFVFGVGLLFIKFLFGCCKWFVWVFVGCIDVSYFCKLILKFLFVFFFFVICCCVFVILWIVFGMWNL